MTSARTLATIGTPNRRPGPVQRAVTRARRRLNVLEPWR